MALRGWASCCVAVMMATVAVVVGFVMMAISFDPFIPHTVLVGAVSHDEAKLWVKYTQPSNVDARPDGLTIEYRQARTSEELRRAQVPPLDAFNNTVLTLVGLSPSTLYEYSLRSTASPNVLANGSFKTFPAPLQSSCHSAGDRCRFRVLFGSCLSVGPWPFHFIRGFPFLLEQFVNANDEFAFSLLLGDNAYTDIHTAIPVRVPFDRAYRQVLSDKGYQALLGVTPTFSMYDDHEVENDFDGGCGDERPHVGEAYSAFQSYIASRNPNPRVWDDGLNDEPSSCGSGYYYTFQYGKDVGVFVLDTRSFRTTETMLGEVQLKRLKNWLQTDPSPMKFIASSVSFNSMLGVGDGWREFTAERDLIFDFISTNNVGMVVLLSGDMHFGAAFQYRQNLFEFSASPFQAIMFPHPPLADKEDEKMIFLSSSSFHFGVLDVNVLSRQVTFSLYGHIFGTPKIVETITVGEEGRVE